MKKYAVVITDADRVYSPKVIVTESKVIAHTTMMLKYYEQLEEFENVGIEIHEGDTFIEDTFAVIETLAGEITYFDIVEVE